MRLSLGLPASRIVLGCLVARGCTTTYGPGMRFRPTVRTRLRGDEQFTSSSPNAGSGMSVLDFWQWTMSDLKENTTRGFLAEYLVMHAVGTREDARTVWGDVDIVTPDGIKLQVKASAFLQAWPQQRASRVVFGGLRGRRWNPDGGYGDRPEYRGDVYVFCVQEAASHEDYDVFDVDQWAFYCVAQRMLEQRGVKSVTLSTVQQLAGQAVRFGALASAVHRACETQRASLV